MDSYIGISPLTITLSDSDDINGEILQIGKQTVTRNSCSGVKHKSPITWEETYNTNYTGRHGWGWTIKAYKEGYGKTEIHIVAKDKYIEATTGKPIDSLIGKKVTAHRTVLIELQNNSFANSSNNSYNNNSNNRSSNYSASAQREYEQALAAYNQALKELNNARTLAAAPKKYPHPALGALMAIAEPHSVAEAERKVEIARQRLERARARINHSEW